MTATTTKLTPVERAYERLKACKSAEEVRQFLKRRKCKGYQGYAGCCPISNYLKRSNGFSVTAGLKLLFFSGRSYPMPAIIGLFIRHFDGGLYPELIKK